jgi:hypothetical protein
MAIFNSYVSLPEGESSWQCFCPLFARNLCLRIIQRSTGNCLVVSTCFNPLVFTRLVSSDHSPRLNMVELFETTNQSLILWLYTAPVYVQYTPISHHDLPVLNGRIMKTPIISPLQMIKSHDIIILNREIALSHTFLMVKSENSPAILRVSSTTVESHWTSQFSLVGQGKLPSR